MNHTMNFYFNGRSINIVAALVLSTLACFLYREALANVTLSVLHREGSSHGVFVPFISGYFLWLKWDKIKQAIIKFTPAAGFLWLFVGFILFFAASFLKEISLSALSFLFVLAGIVSGTFGAGVFKQASFPLFFLVTMIPLPETLYIQLTEIMRAITTAGSVGVLKVLSVSHYREAYEVYLSNITIYVAPSCSGMRYLLSYFVFGLAYAFLFKGSIKSRVLLVLLTIPLSIIAGVLRLSTIFLAAEYIGPFMADRRPHVLLSWAVFVAVLFLAIAVDQFISRRVCKDQCRQ